MRYGKITRQVVQLQARSIAVVEAPVQLSKHDLAQLDAEALAALSPGQLQRLSLKLLSDLKLAHERLDQSPHNSSRPPSSQAPWERAGGDRRDAADQDPSEPASPAPSPDSSAAGADAAADAPADTTEASPNAASATPPSPADEDPAPKRPGQRPGAPGHGRTQTFAITHVVEHHPTHCARCGTPLQDAAPGACHQAHLVLDLCDLGEERIGLELFETKHAYHERTCGCGHVTRAEPGHTPGDQDWGVALSERHLVGPRLLSLICALSTRMRLSRRRIQEFLGDWLSLELSIATINQCVHEAARALEPVVDEQLLEEARASGLLHADETSWFEAGKLVWLWVFTSATTTVFTIGARSKAVLTRMLGPLFNGWLMSDGYWAYRDLDNRLRCLAHVQRKARGLEESLDRQGRAFGEAVNASLKAVMKGVYAAREGPPPTDLRQQHAEQLNALWRLCLTHVDAAHEKTRALARELLNDFDTFWVTLDHPELPLTNNDAERALRHWVIARRISQGTRTAQGSRTVAVLASVIETCRSIRGGLNDYRLAGGGNGQALGAQAADRHPGATSDRQEHRALSAADRQSLGKVIQTILGD